MQIRWSEVRSHQDGLHLHDTLDMSEIQRENLAVIRIAPVSVQIHAIESTGVLHVEGKASSEVVYRCSRCLTDFGSNLEAELSERFVQRAVTAEEQEEEFRSVQGDVVELDPVVYESLVLALPYRPLCNEHCAGLCAVCGTNRNITPCTCDTTPIDPRLANLASLFTDKE